MTLLFANALRGQQANCRNQSLLHEYGGGACKSVTSMKKFGLVGVGMFYQMWRCYLFELRRLEHILERLKENISCKKSFLGKIC